MAITIHEAGRRIALDEIRVPKNVRSLDDAHVQALAGSIKLQGILVPVVVRDDGDGFELVAGFHRIAAEPRRRRARRGPHRRRVAGPVYARADPPPEGGTP